MENYIVVLFKNKKRKRILKKFVRYSKAKSYFDNLIEKSNEVLFEVITENAKQVKYELGIVELSSKQLIPIYMTDDMGRNIKVKLDESDKTLFQIKPYKKEELIYDLKKNKKISTDNLIKSYLKGDGIKMISSLNNKIIIQHEETINIFSLKNESESSRFLDCLSNHFFKIKRGDCLFVKDYSTPQKKYLYELLETNGYDKKILYRKFTTYSPRSK